MFVLVALVLALIPAAAAAQDGEDEGFLMRVDGNVAVPAGDTVDTVLVINGDALIEGAIQTLVVINGDATVRGSVDDEIIVVNGSLNLADTARVQDVTLVDSELERAPGAVVGGEISRRERWGVDIDLFGLFPFLAWTAVSVVVVLAGLLFAAVGGRQLTTAGLLLSDRLGPTLLAALVVWIGVPILAVMLFFTLIGIPAALGLLLLVLPLLWFTGYLVAATRLGAAIVRSRLSTADAEHPYLAALVGTLVLQVIGFIPVLGWLVVWLAGLVGGGALALLGWHAWRGEGTSRQVAVTPAPAAAPPQREPGQSESPA
jgi:hypothetical protein